MNPLTKNCSDQSKIYEPSQTCLFSNKIELDFRLKTSKILNFPLKRNIQYFTKTTNNSVERDIIKHQNEILNEICSWNQGNPPLSFSVHGQGSNQEKTLCPDFFLIWPRVNISQGQYWNCGLNFLPKPFPNNSICLPPPKHICEQT